MTNSLQEFESKFKIAELSIVKFDHWTWSVRPIHSTLGAGILSLNRFCTSFGSITSDEAKDLANATKEIERRLKALFNPEKFNYIMLMMVDSHVHFHVLPRYSSSRFFENQEWHDTGWPALPALGEGAEFSTSNVLQEIKFKLSNI